MPEAHVKGPFPISSLSVDRHRKTEPGTMRTVSLCAETPRKKFSQICDGTACAGRQLAQNSEGTGIQTNERVPHAAAQTSRSQLSDEPPKAAGRLLAKLPVLADVPGERVALTQPR